MIDYRLLGPLEVAVNGHAVDVGGLKQRALLAILLLHANQPVRRDVLIDQLWAEHPPAGAELRGGSVPPGPAPARGGGAFWSGAEAGRVCQ